MFDTIYNNDPIEYLQHRYSYYIGIIIIANWIPTYGCAFSLANVSLPLNITNIEGQVGNNYNSSFKPVGDSRINLNACFAGDQLVSLENGETVPIAKVIIGDRVLSFSPNDNQFVFSPVVAIPHEKNELVSEFNSITTIGNDNIKLTSTHLIPTSDDCNSDTFTLKQAHHVMKGVLLSAYM